MAYKNKPTGRSRDIIVQELDGEILIYDLQADKAFCLNETSALVYQLCDGNNSVSNIKESVSRKLEKPVTDDLIWLALDQLKEKNLLTGGEDSDYKFDGLSRREVIKKVGFASVIALPIISHLVAPTAAMSQSNCTGNNRANGCTCTANPQCTTGCCGTNGITQTCVAVGTEATNSVCRAGCECASACCVSNTCRPGNFGVGVACTTSCECQSNSCRGGVCA